MTREDERFCTKHPNEPLVACDLCLHEVRLATREECARLTQKMRAYRRTLLGKDDKQDLTEGPEDPNL